MSTKTYFSLNPREIFEDIVRDEEIQTVVIKDILFEVHPHVYPSDRFRTTNFVLDSICPLVKDVVVCDMGCGCGVVGEFALIHGAKKVIQVDINPFAVENAKSNKVLHKREDEVLEIFESNCFDRVPHQIFDLIVFNMPYHSEPFEVSDPLEYAFHDPEFKSIKKFLTQLPDYSHSETIVTVAFSNKGDTEGLENIFDQSNFNWTLWKAINTDKQYDNRIYKLRSL